MKKQYTTAYYSQGWIIHLPDALGWGIYDTDKPDWLSWQIVQKQQHIPVQKTMFCASKYWV